MLISHTHKFIYTKTAKTAGTSVESFFERFCMRENEWEFKHGREEYESETGVIGYRGVNSAGKKWYNHMPAKEIKEKAGDAIWNSYFKFCVVRNPYDKLVSGFYFDKKSGSDAPPSDQERIAAFRKWILNGGTVRDQDKYIIDGKICMDYFIRYEELENGMRHVCDRLQISFDPSQLPKLKSGIRDHSIPVPEYYDAATIAQVEKMYALELELFGYKLV